ncbi:hypothetical protein [Algiphilus aromaticivorans]|uniref:hypothetical protein n=1 Tax=Algiphilus aromaticivorans TaxID=382454 RepID=UPI0012EB64F7|nr:hypothetical protein [Algiphilus aromaticivorans]
MRYPNRMTMADAERWLMDWGWWARTCFEQIGVGATAVRAAEDAQLVGGPRGKGMHSDPVLEELLAVERDPEHEWSRRVDVHVRGMDRERQLVVTVRYRGVQRLVHGMRRWDIPDWPEVGKRCGGISAHKAMETCRGAKQILLMDLVGDAAARLAS